MRFSFFKGCFIPIRLPHIEKVSKMVLGELGIELLEIEDFSCCPEPVGFHINDKSTGTIVSARNISLAEEAGHDIITLCNGCTYTLKQANERLKEDEELRERVNEVLADTGHQFRGVIEVKHFAEVLDKDIGADGISRLVEKPLSGLRVAGHTGCHIVSPPEVMGFDDPRDPVVLDRLLSALGAEPADFDLKTLCCGWTLSNYGDRGGGNRVIGEKVEAIQASGADCIGVICPQCFQQFDTGQVLSSRSLKRKFKVPVLFYTQLLALAMGHGIDEVHYDRHRVKPDTFLKTLQGALT